MMLLISDIVIGLCLFALLVSILINFAESANAKVKREKRSIVDTATMTLFFFVFYMLIRFKIGAFDIALWLHNILILAGLVMIVFGCVFNIFKINIDKSRGKPSNNADGTRPADFDSSYVFTQKGMGTRNLNMSPFSLS